MVELPLPLRARLVEELDDYFSTLDGADEPDIIAENIIERMELVAEQLGTVDDDLVRLLDDEIETGQTLIEALSDILDDDLLQGEALIQRLAQLCNIEWLDAGADEDGLLAGEGMGFEDEDY